MVYSDHKPLQYLFSESRPVPVMASARIQSKGTEQSDGLSRLPVEEAPKETLPGERFDLGASWMRVPCDSVFYQSLDSKGSYTGSG
ncbi:hypothetical protein EMCRGX_G007264 [Ephydatia muelleri]